MWKSVHCAVQGVGHRRNGVPCQDKTYQQEENGVHVIALADGAGSAKLSHHGAEVVVRESSAYVLEHFQEWLDCDDGRKPKHALLKMLKTKLEEVAQEHECDIRDLASTLLLAAVDREHFILVHIGDGVIGYLDEGTLKVASMPDNGEFANETTFVTADGASSSMHLFKGVLKDKDAFVLMSDGTAQSFYDKRKKTLTPAIVRLMHRTCLLDRGVMEAKLEDSFSSLISKHTQDDCSIVILARSSAVLRPMAALSFTERQELYGITRLGRSVRRRVRRYDEILSIAKKPLSLNQIAKKINLRSKYAKRHIDKLLSLGLLTPKGQFYQKTSMDLIPS